MRSFASWAYSVSKAAFHVAAALSVPNSFASLSTSAFTLSASLSRFTSTSSASEPAASLIFSAYGSKGAYSTKSASATAARSDGFGS